MELIRLNASEIEVSRIAIGTWSFGGDDASYWGKQEQADVDALVFHALDTGVNFFDTAMSYNDGKSEKSLGMALKGCRERAVICNKIPLQSFEELKTGEQRILHSLKRLQTDYIDVMMMHWPSKNLDLMAANLDLLKRMQTKGYIRAIGVSNFGPGALEFTEKEGVTPALNEIAYNLMTRGAEYETLPYCKAHKIPAAAYMPLMQGILTGKYTSIADIPPARRRTTHFDQANNTAIRHGGSGHEATLGVFLRELRKAALDTGIEACVLSMAWLQQRPGVGVTMVGCRSIEQLDENLAAMRVVLDADIMARLDSISEALKAEMGYNIDLWQGGEDSRVF
ncbi:MAG: General stress protein 69 [Firmicutes bacterium ADurb.Bin182]|nr:MAG: General stress protein 69 [Firmicutes bacterium ADurb.Bin182]